MVLKATKVDGVYNKDPKKFRDAVRYDRISYNEALKQDLKVLDSAAFALCRDNQMPIIVFDFFKPHNLLHVVTGQPVGTLVTD